MIIEDMKHGSPDMKKPDIAQSIDVLWAQIRLYADAYSALKTAHGEMQQQLLSADKLRLAKEKEQERVLIIENLKMVDKCFLSIDKDRTVIETIKFSSIYITTSKDFSS